MEKFLENFLTLLNSLYTMPFSIKYEQGLNIHLSIPNPKALKIYIWKGTCIVMSVYFIMVYYFLIQLIPKYLEKGQYDKLAFHCIWALSSLDAVAAQLPNWKQAGDVIQLGSGLIRLIQNLENGTKWKYKWSR